MNFMRMYILLSMLPLSLCAATATTPAPLKEQVEKTTTSTGLATPSLQADASEKTEIREARKKIAGLRQELLSSFFEPRTAEIKKQLDALQEKITQAQQKKQEHLEATKKFHDLSIQALNATKENLKKQLDTLNEEKKKFTAPGTQGITQTVTTLQEQIKPLQTKLDALQKERATQQSSLETSVTGAQKELMKFSSGSARIDAELVEAPGDTRTLTAFISKVEATEQETASAAGYEEALAKQANAANPGDILI